MSCPFLREGRARQSLVAPRLLALLEKIRVTHRLGIGVNLGGTGAVDQGQQRGEQGGLARAIDADDEDHVRAREAGDLRVTKLEMVSASCQ